VRDPWGIHKTIWDEIEARLFALTPDEPLTLAAYVADVPKTAYVKPIAVGDVMPDMPAYLDPDSYVPVALEATYMAIWTNCPEPLREVVEQDGPTPDEPAE
jgi:hypothetical protein